MLNISNLQVKVEDKEILKKVSFEIKKGQVVAFMGRNGSGKSSLAFTIAGHPKYEVSAGSMAFEGKTLAEMSPDERSKAGIFLSNQYPVAIAGLLVCNYLWQIYKLHNKEKPMKLGDFRMWMQEEADKLKLAKDIMTRSLNDGFSGGEKKKMELLQILVTKPKLIILDEIDSGLDVEALEIIAKTIARLADENEMAVMVITHYSRIFKYLRPEIVNVVEEGKIVKSGGYEIVEKIETEGYIND